MSTASSIVTPLRLVWLIVLILVGWRLGQFIDNGLFAVRYPYEFDYGEGIVWQQADMILAGRGYGDITRYPYIVFHYPPIYHLAASGLNVVMPGDWLLAGRFLSLAATLISASLCAWIVLIAGGRHGDRIAGAILAAIFFLSAAPIVLWGALARVDMLALLLCLAGLVAGIRAVERPRQIHFASLLFVLALFTRQTAIFAPAALFGVLLLTRPRLALAGIGSSITFGLAGLTIMTALTDGRFIDHAFLYNVNRFALSHFNKIVHHALGYQPLLWILTATAGAGLAFAVHRTERWPDWRTDLARSPAPFAVAVTILYLVISLLSFVLVAKIGSNVNYFVDMCAAAGILVGIAAAQLPRQLLAGRPSATFFAPSLVTIVAMSAVITIPQVNRLQASDRPSDSSFESLVAEIRTADKPVLSDDMVILRKAGRQVPWESAIFSELAYAGMWDEQPIVRMIEQQRFAFIRTVGERGIPLFHARYRPAIADAIDRAYPVKARQGEFTNHYPRPPR